jgi:hypothetical protein
MKGISGRINKKFRYMIVNGHGNPNLILLKSAARTTISISNSSLLKQAEPLFVDGFDVILNSCSTAGGDTSNNLAKSVAQSLDARCFGAANDNPGISQISFGSGLEIMNVTFIGSVTRSYDYRKTIPPVGTLTHPALRTARSGSGYIIQGFASGNSPCTVFDLSGRAVARIIPDKSHNLIWNSSNEANGQYIIRIPRAEGQSISKIIKPY